jgi:UDP-N-acetylglucosamine 2-epimerase (non-hydrolysing)
MTSILIIAGTRPEIIKVAPLLLGAREEFKDLDVKFCLTGQHRTMAEEAMSIFGIQPDTDMEIMKPGQTLNDIAEAVFAKMPTVMKRFDPDLVLVQGDTTTAAMAALCAFNMDIPVGHIEAGLRSFNLEAPYPEECNRRVINAFARFNFAPTRSAVGNLRKENIPEERIFLTGNTVVDSIQYIVQNHNLDDVSAVKSDLRSPYVLVTAHRRESFGGGFERICRAIKECSEQFPDVQFIYPVHLNPNVRKPVQELLGGHQNVFLIPPVPYLHLLTLLKNSSLVLTDSGGIQEEAPSFGKYCIVMRSVTERTESIQMGVSELVGTDVDRIVAAVSRELSEHKTPVGVENPYGDGNATRRILETVRSQPKKST